MLERRERNSDFNILRVGIIENEEFYNGIRTYVGQNRILLFSEKSVRPITVELNPL